MIPCWKVADYGDYEVGAECIDDQAKLNEYLDAEEDGYYETYIYYNYDFFDADQFGEEAIQR